MNIMGVEFTLKELAVLTIATPVTVYIAKEIFVAMYPDLAESISDQFETLSDGFGIVSDISETTVDGISSVTEWISEVFSEQTPGQTPEEKEYAEQLGYLF